VWVDKDRFDVVRMRFSDGGSVDFEDYRGWEDESVRFPHYIKVSDPYGPVASIRVLGVDPAPELDGESFAPSWLE
jgi:hypothetical protein